MEGGEENSNNQEKLAGFIFMCNKLTKTECYRFRVFGLPAGRKEVVGRINPGTYLFLFDTDVKLLYGIYTATSSGKLRIEPLAFGGKFPAQVRFKIHKDCLPLRENCFKHAIQDNYQKDSNKFNPELDSRQVKSLLSLFRPLPVLLTAPAHPVLKKTYSPLTSPLPPVNNIFNQISRPSFSEDVYLSRMSPYQVPRQLNYKHVNELEQPTGCAYPAINMMPTSAAAQSVLSQASRNQLHPPSSSLTLEGTYAAGMGSSYNQPLPDPQYTQYQHILNLQPEFHSSLVNRGSGYAQSLQDPQHAHHNIQHLQPQFHSSMMTMGSSHAQALQYPRHAHQALQYPRHAHQSIVVTPPDFHSPVVNVGSSHVQLLHDPHYAHQIILNPQPDSYSSTVTMGRSYVQSLPDPQYTHQNIPSLQPNQNSSVNMDHANIMMQSLASSSLYCPSVPQVVSAAYPGSGAAQGLISGDRHSGIGKEYHQSSMQAENISTQENVFSHNLYSTNSYSQC